jgi:hypothetical protein
MNEDNVAIVNNLVEVKLRSDDDFLKVKETLTRIGIPSRKDRTLYQSCHILHKQKKYYIVHFKELFALDGKPSNFSESDRARRNTIVKLLKEWELVDVDNFDKLEEDVMCPISQIKVLSYKDKDNWNLKAKYNIGRKS